MSLLRLLSKTRQQLWQSAKRRKATATTEVATGPEPPNGFLFNEKVAPFLFSAHHGDIHLVTCLLTQPLLPGEKRQKEPWENIWLYGMTFNFLLMIGVIALKPDTR